MSQTSSGRATAAPQREETEQGQREPGGLEPGARAAATLREGESFTTVELKINFLRAGRQGKLTAEAKVVKAGSALGYVECDVTDQAGKLVARASSTCMKLRQDRPPTA